MLEERWEKAIASAIKILEQFEQLPNKEDYSWVISSIKAYLYLAEVWNRQGLSVLEWLEELDFDLKKWKTRKIQAVPGRKGGGNIIEE